MMVCQFMQEHKDEHSIREMDMSFRGVKQRLLHIGEARSDKKTEQGGRRTARSHPEDRETASLVVRESVGTRRTAEHLRETGQPEKVARLTRENGLNVRRRGRFIPTTISNHGLPVCENLLNREFQAGTAGAKWVSDIACLQVLDGWLYLTVVADLYDRKVIGWAFSIGLETVRMFIPALRMAFQNRTAQEGLVFHSDRGAQYCSNSFHDDLSACCPTVRQRMIRKGNCWDNACAESFFKTLKRELETLDSRHIAAEVRQSVFMYIEAYYNRLRLYSTLDYVAPDMFNSGRVA
jgi:transposase InsO family protein